jgi:hypothetical protein
MTTLQLFLDHYQNSGFWDSVRERKYWTKIFLEQRAGRIDTWDYQWKFTLWRDQALAVYPNANLVSNLGFNNQATNTVNPDRAKADRDLEQPLRLSGGEWHHPTVVERHKAADVWTFKHLYWGGFSTRLLSKLRKLKQLLVKKR